MVVTLALIGLPRGAWAQHFAPTAAPVVAPAAAELPKTLDVPAPPPTPEPAKANQMSEVLVHGRAEDLLDMAIGAAQGAIGEADLSDDR